MEQTQPIKREINKINSRAAISSTVIDPENQIIQLSISSETPVLRSDGMGIYYEVLLHTPEAVDLSRANDGAAVLEKHYGEQIGVFEKCWIENARLIAQLRFSKANPKAVTMFQDMQAGIIRNFSIDYSIESQMTTGLFENQEVMTVSNWTLLGVSVAPIPADATIGIGRSLIAEKGTEKQEAVKIEVIKQRSNKQMEKETLELESSSANEIKRRDAIDAIAERYSTVEGVSELGKTAVREKMAEDKFRNAVLDLLAKKASDKSVNSLEVSNSDWFGEKEQKEYSISRHMNAIINNTPLDGIELEVSREMERRYGRPTKGNMMIPIEAFGVQRKRQQDRALQVAPGTSGGFLIGTETMPLIELLRNKTYVMQLGAKILPGLTNDLSFPTQTAAASVSYLGDTATNTVSQQTIGQIISRPKYMRAQTQFSKGLVAQASVAVENFVREDFARIVALALDKQALVGAGGNAPLGILNTTGISTTSTATATWGKFLAFEQKVSEKNGDFGTLNFLTTPAIRAELKALDKGSLGANFVWNDKDEINGYKSYATNQVPTKNIIFGDFSQVLIPTFGAGMEIEVIKTTNYVNQGLFDAVVYFPHDVIIRQPGAFCVSTDYAK